MKPGKLPTTASKIKNLVLEDKALYKPSKSSGYVAVLQDTLQGTLQGVDQEDNKALLSHLVPEFDPKNDSMDHWWVEVLNVMEDQLSEPSKELARLIKYILILPHGQASVERLLQHQGHRGEQGELRGQVCEGQEAGEQCGEGLQGGRQGSSDD